MDKDKVFLVIDMFKNSLRQKGININRIILFGSYAKENQTTDSDIDLVIISESFQEMDYWERTDTLAEAISDIFQPIEAIAMTPEEWDKKDSFIVDYASEGIVVG